MKLLTRFTIILNDLNKMEINSDKDEILFNLIKTSKISNAQNIFDFEKSIENLENEIKETQYNIDYKNNFDFLTKFFHLVFELIAIFGSIAFWVSTWVIFTNKTQPFRELSSILYGAVIPPVALLLFIFVSVIYRYFDLKYFNKREVQLNLKGVFKAYKWTLFDNRIFIYFSITGIILSIIFNFSIKS